MIGVLVLIIAGSVAAIVLLTGGSSGRKAVQSTPPAPASPQQPQQPQESQQPQQPAFTVDEMHNALVAYVTAFGHEDPVGLERLFSVDLVRRNGSDPPQGLLGALNTYDEQFAKLRNPNYVLSNITYSTTTGLASGVYKITSDNAPTSTGGISFHFVRQNGQLLIDAISIAPE